MDFLKLIVWPAAVVLISSLVLLIFRKSITKKIEQIQKFTAKETEIRFERKLADLQKESTAPTSPVTQLEAKIESKASTDSKLNIEDKKPQIADATIEFEKEKSVLSNSPTTREWSAEIKKGLRPVTFHYSKDQIMELGMLQLGRLVMFLDFWRIYTFVFGSQIEFLQTVNTRPIGEDDARQFFHGVKQRFPEHPFKDKQTKDYLEFLFANKLLDENKRETNTVYFVTEKGREFLQWCIGASLPLNKPF